MIENEILHDFGLHPDLKANSKSIRRHAVKNKKNRFYIGPKKNLKNFQDNRHPEIFLIPRNIAYHIINDFEDYLPIINFPFSSFNFYVEDDEDENGLFCQLTRARAFLRLSGISQLGYLVPPRPKEIDPQINILYCYPTFLHTRYLHSIIVAILMELVLARNNFDEKTRAPIVLTAGYHDIAMPAGGDPVKNIDSKELDEEKNFSFVLSQSGLAKEWEKLFNFNLKTAQEWVENKGVFGFLLDILDKLSYTMLDCYALGRERSGRIRDFCLTHPFISDIWQDIKFTEDKTQFGFCSKERLYDFLFLRALEHVDLLFNPESRKLDLLLAKEIKPLYEEGKITKEQLLLMDNSELEHHLSKIKPERITYLLEPDKVSWEKFETKQEAELFCTKINPEKLERMEEIRPFKPGLHFPVLFGSEIKELKEVLEPDKIKKLELLASSRAGYYVFYYK